MFEHSSSLTKEKALELMGTIKMPQLPTWTLLGIATIVYLSVVQLLRFRSFRKTTKTYSAYLHDPYSLDYQTAHHIMRRVMLYETPFMYAFGTQWALLKTYTVASGTELLVQTRQLTSPSTVGKRAEDTSIILTEFLVGSIDSDRGSKALAKMNWLHRRYGTKIKQPELLHTLAMFVLEPIRWLAKYEWRPLTELEKVAIFVYWKEIGNRMGIKNIPDSLEELEAWTEVYEETNVYFTENNKRCADATMGLFLRNVSMFLRGFAQHAAVSLFEEKSRLALGYEAPPRWIAGLIATFFQARKFAIRHLFLPRLHELDPLAKPDATGRLFRDAWAFEPWYVKATVKIRLEAWFWTKGKVVPGVQFRSEGFLVEELGPAEFEMASREQVVGEAEEMRGYAEKGGAVGLGCPFVSVRFPNRYGA